MTPDTPRAIPDHASRNDHHRKTHAPAPPRCQTEAEIRRWIREEWRITRLYAPERWADMGDISRQVLRRCRMEHSESVRRERGWNAGRVAFAMAAE